ncbi:hypothetical protein SEMRO_2176_G317830.1 [Seminavis robusta]|uniref:Uncharacterized protein n=1 Tax=Seminavis robusta TaxID=568900 RepID=A0A9N8HXC5_9STRA|nr:hypothetical protein SEMRO_2176_G317830.1 [Seminavis robusta]|eukprot:Sro2176_g317830.1 n/a (372) ;mRNA; f:10754-11869
MTLHQESMTLHQEEILETTIIGFPEPLGEQTLEEINDINSPIFGVPECLISANNDLEDEYESTLPPPTPLPTPPPTPPLVVPNGLYSTSFTLTTRPTGTEMMNAMTTGTVPGANNDQLTHAPDDITWIPTHRGVEAQWDGIPFDPTGKTNGELCDFLRPGQPYVIRGIREKFYELNPFADNANPTPSEIDLWNIEVIRHFRALLGVTTPVQPDGRLYLESRWADERKYTQTWDTKYPRTGVPGAHNGVCFQANGDPIDIAGGHCGESFFVDATDRATYISASPYQNDFSTYPELASYNTRFAQTSGLSGAPAYLPWSMKFPWIIANFICGEGLGGHAGPYVGPDACPFFGCSFWREDPAANWVNFRGKWSG